MPRGKPSSTLSVDHLDQLLDYSPSTGVLTWRVNRGRTAKAGDEAGTVTKDGVVMVGIDGRMYSAARVAWVLGRREAPKARVRFYNGDSQDLRLENLVLEGQKTMSTNTAARYQRRRRRELKAVDAYITQNPERMTHYMSLDPVAAQFYRDEVLDKVREWRLRTHGHTPD